MREIFFRGRTKDGKWHNGWYVKATKPMKSGSKQHEDWIVSGFSANGGWVTPLARYAVDADTIGQYTGLKDKNGVKIFEGDIVEYDRSYHKVVFCNFMGNAYFGIRFDERGEIWGFSPSVPSERMKVIGNIYDNPELLKEESE